MQVASRPTRSMEAVLDNEETAAVLRYHLELNDADTQAPMLAEAVFACRDPNRGRHIRRGWRRFVHGGSPAPSRGYCGPTAAKAVACPAPSTSPSPCDSATATISPSCQAGSLISSSSSAW